MSETYAPISAANQIGLADYQAISRVAGFDVRAYGAIGDGVIDDTVAVQAAITAAQAVGGIVRIPPGTYRITDELVVSAPVTIAGVGVQCLFGDRSVYGSDVVPMVAPYLRGSVLLQTTAGKHGIRISVVGRTVVLRDFGVRFGDAIKFASTGHGVYADPAGYVNAGDAHSSPGTYTNNGLDGGHWQSVYVYGQDGNHYAFYVKNAQLMTMTDLQGYGGGGLCWHVDTGYGWYGNSTLINCYMLTLVAGTGHGYYLKRSVAGHGVILMTMVRPQSFFLNDLGLPGVTPPNGGQYNFYADDDTQFLTVVGGDFEDATPNPGWRLPVTLPGLYFQAVDTAHGQVVTLNSSTQSSFGKTSATAVHDVYGLPNVDGALRGIAVVTDASPMAAGVGGGVTSAGHYTAGGAIGSFGGVVVVKANGTDGDYASEVLLIARINGGPPTAVGRIGGDGVFKATGLQLGGVTLPAPAGGQAETTSGDTTLASALTTVPGLTATLAAGTWLVSAVLRLQVPSGGAGYASCGVYNGDALLSTVTLLQASQSEGTQSTVCPSWRITLTSTTTILLRGQSPAGATRVFSDAAGKSILTWTRVA